MGARVELLKKLLLTYRLRDNLLAFDPRGGLLRNMALQFRVTPLLLWAVFGTIIVAAVDSALTFPFQYAELALMYLLMLAAIVPLGILFETRVYWDFVPLLVIVIAGNRDLHRAHSGREPATAFTQGDDCRGAG